MNIFVFMESLTLNVTRGSEQVDAASFCPPVQVRLVGGSCDGCCHLIELSSQQPGHQFTFPLSFLVHEVQGPSLGAFFFFLYRF